MLNSSPSQIRQLQNRLLRWFRANQRALPWRDTRDPYAIWVSEVMLQQTQVTAVIPFYRKFMGRFPTLQELACATEQEVLQYWEGLGYYRRARHLHQAARQIVDLHDGVIPRDETTAKELPGWGRYTVGAVLSQAYDARLPIVDANVARVFTRLFAWREDVSSRATQEWLWQQAESLLPKQHVGDFNQAWMELGQTVCTTGEPSCLLCPLREQCQALRLGIASKLPYRSIQPKISNQREAAILLWRGDTVLLCQRSADAKRWASMWEFPTMTLPDKVDACLAWQAEASERLGISPRNLKPLGALTYGITRFKVTLEVVKATTRKSKANPSQYQKHCWLKRSELAEYPLSVPQRKVAQQFVLHSIK